MSGKQQAQATLYPPGKTQYPFDRRLGGPQGQSGQVENLAPTGIWSRTVQCIVSHYADWATRTKIGVFNVLKKKEDEKHMEISKKKGRKEKHRDKETVWEMEEKFSVTPTTCLLWLSKASYA